MLSPILAGLIVLLGAGAENALTNGDFSDGAGAPAAGWHLSVGSGEASAARRERGGTDGGAYVEVTLADKGSVDVRPTAGFVPVDPERAYLLTCAVKASNAGAGSHAAELQWFGEGGFLSRDIASASVAQRWVRVGVGPVRPPEGATRVIVLLRCYDAGTYGFDDAALREVGGRGGALLSNPGFESDGDGDGSPDGWARSGTGARAEGDGAAASGRVAARAEAGSSWRQADVAVTGSARYALSAATRADAFGRELRLAIEWFSGEGETLGAGELTDQTREGWQVKTLHATAPADAARARVVLANTGAGTVWFDDASLVELGRDTRIALRLAEPGARGLIREGIDAREVRVACTMESDDPALSLRLRLVDAGGKTLAEATPDWTSGAVAWSPGVDGLGRGAYRVVAEALRADGGEPVARAMRCVDVVAGDAHGLYFREDRIAMVNGEPWFPIGVTSFRPTSAEAKRIAEAGFNLLVPGSFTNRDAERVQAELAAAENLGVYVMEWNNGHAYGQVSSEQRHRRFADSAAKVDGHRRFLGWLCDEALWNGVPLEKVRDAYLAARSAAPTLAFWQNQAPRNTVSRIARYAQWSDVTGVDIYPVEGSGHSDLPNKTLSVVGDEIEKQHETVDGRKPVWAILQGFGWNAWEDDPSARRRAPDWAETRFMAYDAIVHGATGIVYWGAHYEDQASPIWGHLRRIAGELAELESVLTAAERPAVTVQGAGAVGTARRANGTLWVILVNETGDEVEARIGGLAGVERLERFEDGGQAVAVADGQAAVTLEAWGVWVLRQR